MYKLLIVLAIQFCLPLFAELLQQAITSSTRLLLPVVAVQAACIGCALGLMWPRWRWMLLTALLAGVFWEILLKVYLITNSNFPEFPNLNFTWAYYDTVLNATVLACCITTILVYHCQLTWQQTIAVTDRPRSIWQFTSRSFLYYSGCAALTVGAVVRLYNPVSRDIWGIGLVDLWVIAMSMIMFLHLLQRSINWLSLGCCFILMCALWLFVYYKTWADYFSLLEAYTFVGSFLGFCTLSVWLFRWAGFRIVPRRELALNSSSPGQL